jgi:hypothetical protein
MISGITALNEGRRLSIRVILAADLPGGRTGAGVLYHKPDINWTKDCGKRPERPKVENPWFWS